MAKEDIQRSMRVPGQPGSSQRSDFDSSGAIPRFKEVVPLKVVVPEVADLTYDPGPTPGSNTNP